MPLRWFKKTKEDREKDRSLPSPEKEAPGRPSNLKAPVAEIPNDGNATSSSDDQPVTTAIEERDREKVTGTPKGGRFVRLRAGLAKTRKLFTSDLDALFAGKTALDEDLLEELEELLITSDIGVKTAMALIDQITGKTAGVRNSQELKMVLREEILEIFREHPTASAATSDTPHVVMVVGVNGVGKTTTIGKLAALLRSSGKSVLIAAADTFRAAAVEQLSIWAQRAGADIVKHRDGADPAAVAYDSLEAALARGTNVVMIDTAGRLHTKVNLMEELKKIKRAISKVVADAPHETLLVLDATTGQNALSQAKLFNDALEISGIALTKLDGTAKGGIVVSIYHDLGIPLKYIGVGEKIEDLQVFDPQQYVEALF